jgi:hypothetical protein
VRIYDAGRIASAFPDVRFIFVKRNLDDNLLRIFMRRYAVGNSYSYNLKSARQHIGWYHQMIDALAEKLSQITRVVQYEDVIAAPAAMLEAGAELCGLSMTDIMVPILGDDRDCSKPYRALMATALEEAT